MSITVSVVIPTFNRPEATIRAAESALAQTRPPDEIVIVDDASQPPFSSETPAIQDRRVRIVRLPSNRGASGARQAGVEAATGDLIAFLDSDDRWLPGKLEAQMALLERHPGELVAVSCGWLEEGAQSRTRIPIPSADPADFASGCWFSPGTTVIVPKAAFARVGPFDPNLKRLEDLDWFLRFGLLGGRLEVAPIIGAKISIGRRGRSLPVEQASQRIRERFRNRVPPRVQRRLEAYLALECAAAARNDGRYRAMLARLARSFFASPRPRLPLRKWWH